MSRHVSTRVRLFALLPFYSLALFGGGNGADGIDVGEIVRRSTAAMQANWAAAPGFAFVQRDVTRSGGRTTSKTHQVLMISGSDYYMPIAVNDEPLPLGQQRLELERVRQEIARRSQESPAEVERRAEQYRKMRAQNRILLNEFVNAFDFTLGGEETVNGQAAYVLIATPRVGYQPPNRTAKILAGMHGRLWVAKGSCQWLRAEAEASKPISVFGVFARILPGTRMELELEPVTGSVWLVSRFTVDARYSIFWWKSAKRTESIFRNYEAATAALARLGIEPANQATPPQSSQGSPLLRNPL